MEIDNKDKYSWNKTKIIAITYANKVFKNQGRWKLYKTFKEKLRE